MHAKYHIPTLALIAVILLGKDGGAQCDMWYWSAYLPDGSFPPIYFADLVGEEYEATHAVLDLPVVK